MVLFELEPVFEEPNRCFWIQTSLSPDKGCFRVPSSRKKAFTHEFNEQFKITFLKKIWHTQMKTQLDTTKLKWSERIPFDWVITPVIHPICIFHFNRKKAKLIKFDPKNGAREKKNLIFIKLCVLYQIKENSKPAWLLQKH